MPRAPEGQPIQGVGHVEMTGYDQLMTCGWVVDKIPLEFQKNFARKMLKDLGSIDQKEYLLFVSTQIL